MIKVRGEITKNHIKISIIILILLILINYPVYATDEIISSQMENLNISSFIQEGKKYTKETFPEIDLDELLNSTLKGNIDNENLLKGTLSLFLDKFISTVKILGSILIIIVIHSILKTISENLSNKGVAEIAYYVQYILIVTVIMSNFSQIISMVKESIENLVGLINSLVPILLALMTATGNITSATMIEPIIILATIFIGNIVTVAIIPILLVSTVIGIISNLSNEVQIGKLAKFFKSGIIWFLGVVISIFIAIISLEGNLTSSIDGLAAKGIKATVSNVVPVVGKALGDSVDTVLGCASLLKNSIGIVGLIMIIGICISPIIELTLLTITYKFAAAICEPIADKKVVSLLEQMGGTFKVFLGIMFFVSILFIIGISITIKITNAGMMYR